MLQHPAFAWDKPYRRWKMHDMKQVEMHVDKIPVRVAVVGVPLDENSSFLRGPALAPACIRAALRSGAMNLCTEDGDDLDARSDWRDLGDFELGHGPQAMADIKQQMLDLVTSGARVLSLGG